MDKIIAHPETGRPARVVESYIELDEAQLRQELVDNQADLDELLATKRAEFEEKLDNDPDVKTARSAVEDSKSELDQYESVASQPADATPEEGAGSEDESTSEDEAESSDDLDESAEASEDDAEAEDVPVNHVTPTTETTDPTEEDDDLGLDDDDELEDDEEAPAVKDDDEEY